MAETPLQPLSVGNAVSAGFRLYRDRLSDYLAIAARATAWLFIPILALIPLPLFLTPGSVNLLALLFLIPIIIALFFFGFGKYTANTALISRLAFGTLANKPETVSDATRHVIPQMWQFLWAVVLIGLIWFVAYIVFIVVYAVLAGIGAAVFAFSAGNFIVTIIAALVALALLFFSLMFFIRLVLRFSIFEVPLAVESDLNGKGTLARSWKLTDRQVGRIFAIFIVAGLITLPIQLLSAFIADPIANSLASVFSTEKNSPTFVAISLLINTVISLALSIFLVPFWQAIKATIYYDLRTRKEGLDLQLRKRSLS